MEEPPMHRSPIVPVLLVLVIFVGGYLVYRNAVRPVKDKSTQDTSSPQAQDPKPSATDAPDGSELVSSVSQVTLLIASPQSGGTVTTGTITVRGRTVPGAEIFANEAETVADSAGNFSLTVGLDEGENSIIVTAVDGDGNVSEKELFVTYDKGE